MTDLERLLNKPPECARRDAEQIIQDRARAQAEERRIEREDDELKKVFSEAYGNRTLAFFVAVARFTKRGVSQGEMTDPFRRDFGCAEYMAEQLREMGVEVTKTPDGRYRILD